MLRCNKRKPKTAECKGAFAVPWPGEGGWCVDEVSSLLVVFAAVGNLPPVHSPNLDSSCGTSASMRLREFISTASWESTCSLASVEI